MALAGTSASFLQPALPLPQPMANGNLGVGFNQSVPWAYPMQPSPLTVGLAGLPSPTAFTAFATAPVPTPSQVQGGLSTATLLPSLQFQTPSSLPKTPSSSSYASTQQAEAPAHHHHSPSGSKTQAAYNALSALGLAVATNALPAPKGVSSMALIPTDPRAYAKVGLGLFATNQFNQLLGLTLPTWALALENAAVIHTLMMGLKRQSLVSFGLMTPIILGTVAASHVAHKATDAYFDRSPQPDKRWRAATEWGLKGAVTVAAITVGLKLFPRTHLWAAKQGWFGKEASYLQEQALSFYRSVAGTKESEAFLKSAAEASHGDALHHRHAVEKIGKRLAQLLEHKADEVLKQDEAGSHLWETLRKHVPQLGQTVEQDYTQFKAIIAPWAQAKPAIERLAEQPKALLNNLLQMAEHQLGHAPKPLKEVLKQRPFFKVLDEAMTSGGKGSSLASQGLATFTCANGCCTGSLLCLADVADLFTTLWSNLKASMNPAPPALATQPVGSTSTHSTSA